MPLPEKGVENHRREALADIVKNRNAQLAAELGEGGEEEIKAAMVGTEPPLEDPRKPDDVSVEDWSAMSDEDKANAIKSADAPADETVELKAEVVEPKTEKLKIDGQEQDVSVDKIMEHGRKALQKEIAADKRLEEASKLFKEAQEMIKNAAAGATAQVSTASPSKDGSPVADEALAKVAKALQYGSEAEAQSALSELITAAQAKGQALTQNDVLELLDYRDARQWVEGEYKDVLGDAKLRALFVSEEKRIRAAGDGRPYRELYEEIGTGLRDWKKSLTPTLPVSTGTGRADIKVKKTTVVTVPVAAARQPEKLQPKEPSQSEIIESIRKSRHQA